jgi:tetratricopeptide (TPR) repeat protein
LAHDIHITRHLLHAAADGKLPQRSLIELYLQHLHSLCPICLEEQQAFLRERQQPPSVDFLAPTLEAVRRALPGIEREQKLAERWLAELEPLAPAARLPKLEKARLRFRGRAFAEALLQKSRGCLPADAAGARHWAELAEAAVVATARGDMGQWVRAVAYQANALRLADERPQAARLFDHARAQLITYGVTDLDVAAELDSLQASLYTDLRRFAAAEELLARAAQFYELLEQPDRQVRVLIKLGNLFYDRQNFDAAIEAGRLALKLVDEVGDRPAYLMARFNLASYQCAAGLYQGARDNITLDEHDWRTHPDPWTRLRVRWLEGRIAAGLEDWSEAEEALLEARDGFVDRGHAFDTACVSLDLAKLYYRCHRWDPLERVVTVAVTLFEEQQVHAEALKALVLLQHSIVKRHLTFELLDQTARFLDRAQGEPVGRVQ